MADEVQETQQPAATGEGAASTEPAAATEGAVVQSVTIENKLANLQALVVELTKQLSDAQFQIKQLQVQAALASKNSAKDGNVPSMTAILRRLDRHGIRVQPEDEDEVAAGSGSERWGSAAWTEAGDGKDYPAA